MATNFVAAGNSIEVTAPVGGVVGGAVYKQGEFIGVVEATAAEGEIFTLHLAGAWTVPKATSLVITKGDKVYWDVADGNFNKTSTDNFYAGKAFSTAASNDTTFDIRFDN